MSDALLPALADVLDETLDDLRAEADPRRAVIAAYARMERALARLRPAARPVRGAGRVPAADLRRPRRQPPRHLALDGALRMGEVLGTRCGAGDEGGGDRGARGGARGAARGRDPGRAAAARGPGRAARAGRKLMRRAWRVGRAPRCCRRSASRSRSPSRRAAPRSRCTSGSSSCSGVALLAFIGARHGRLPAHALALRREPRRGRPRSVERPAALSRLEREVSMAGSAAFDLHFRLRPTVTALAAELLSSRRGHRSRR